MTMHRSEQKIAVVSTARNEALSRTVLLLRDFFGPEVSDDRLLGALSSVSVLIVCDHCNLSSADAQSCVITVSLLIARAGGRVYLDLAEEQLVGPQPPLRGSSLTEALLSVLGDLIPGSSGSTDPPQMVDLAVVIGDSPWRGAARRVVRLQSDIWTGVMSERISGERWVVSASPFGSLAAAGLAAGEAFKIALLKVGANPRSTIDFNLSTVPTREASIALAPAGTPAPAGKLPDADWISGGAINHSAIYALARISGVQGAGRIIEPDNADLSNLNRYALLRHSDVGISKSKHLALLADAGELAGLSFVPIEKRYDETVALEVAPLQPHVNVGVDDIPSRWLVQQQKPQWLGIGATTHFNAMASFHIWNEIAAGVSGCAQCLHPTDDPDPRLIPTVAFVSHWAGLWLASLFARASTGEAISPRERSVFMAPLRAERPEAVWRAPVAYRSDCPVHLV